MSERLAELIGVIEAPGPVDICEWVDANASRVKETLTERGGVMLRGFRAEADTIAEEVLGRIGHELLDDAFWSTPRTGVAKKTFTATEYSSDRSISLHSEMSYMTRWPRLIAFHALVVAEEGGATTLCELGPVSEALAPVMAKFRDKGVIYQRTHRKGVDVPWQKAFQTEDRARVAEIASTIGMELNWIGDVLQTRHAAQGCVADESGRPLWFNQTHVFHPANLAPAALASLTKLFGKDQLPRNAFYGDGTPIESSVLDEIRGLYEELAIRFDWQLGDIVMLDNFLTSHGREPFTGPRKILVAMAELYTSAE